MDDTLWHILGEEGPKAHEFTEDKLLVKQHEGIVDTEGVQHSGKQHVLPNEGSEASALHVRLVQGTLLDTQESEEHDEGEDKVDHDHDSRWIEVELEVFYAVTDQDGEEDRQEGIKSGYLSHEEFDDMPFVEFENGCILDIPLDPEHYIDLPDTIQGRIASIDVVERGLVCLTTVVGDEEEGEDEGDDIVRDRPQVQLTLDGWHEVSLHSHQALCVILEGEGLMLVMDE